MSERRLAQEAIDRHIPTDYVEHVDEVKLKWIVNNIRKLDIERIFRIIPPLTGEICDEASMQAQITMLKWYSDKCKDGKVKTQAKDNTNALCRRRQTILKGKQREKGQCLPSMCRAIRHAICSGHMVDVDIENCQPNLLEQWCEKEKWQCPQLKLYNKHRQKVFQDLIEAMGWEPEDGKDKCKVIVLKIINGGDGLKDLECEFIDEFWTLFDQEMRGIRMALTEVFPTDFRKIKANKKVKWARGNPNYEGSLINYLMMTLEDNCLQLMVESLMKSGYEIGSLCYDGLHVVVDNVDDNLEMAMNDAQDHVAAISGYYVHLKVKPFDQGVELPEDYLQGSEFQKHMEDGLKQLRLLSSHKAWAQVFVEVFGEEHLKLTSLGKGGKLICWDGETRLWAPYDESPIELISDVCLQYIDDVTQRSMREANMACLSEADESWAQEQLEECKTSKPLCTIINNLGTTGFQVGIGKQLFARKSLVDVDWYRKTLNRKRNELPLKCGLVVDLATGKTRLREYTDAFSVECPVSMVSDVELPKAEGFFMSLCRTSTEEGNPELCEYLQTLLGYYLTGETRDRKMVFFTGIGCNGKSKLFKFLKAMMGDKFFATLDKSVIIQGPKKSGGSHSSELMCLLTARLAAVMETDENEKLAAGRIKAITGDDGISAREIYEKAIEFETQAKIAALTNHPPRVDTTQAATLKRLNFLPCNAIFDASPENDAYLDGLMEESLDELFTWVVRGAIKFYGNNRGLVVPQCVLDANEAFINDNDHLSHFMEEFVEKNGEYQVRVNEVYEAYAEWARGEFSGVNVEDIMNVKKFSQAVVQRGFEKKKKSTMYFVGMRLKNALTGRGITTGDPM